MSRDQIISFFNKFVKSKEGREVLKKEVVNLCSSIEEKLLQIKENSFLPSPEILGNSDIQDLENGLEDLRIILKLFYPQQWLFPLLIDKGQEKLVRLLKTEVGNPVQYSDFLLECIEKIRSILKLDEGKD